MFHARASLFGEKMDPSILKKMEGLDYELAHHQQNRLFVIDKVSIVSDRQVSLHQPSNPNFRIDDMACRFEGAKLSAGMEETYRSEPKLSIRFAPSPWIAPSASQKFGQCG